MTEIRPEFSQLEQVITEQVPDHSGDDLAFVKRHPQTRLNRLPIHKCLAKRRNFLGTEPGLGHFDVDAGTLIRLYVYSLAMAAAIPTPDFDQSVNRRQRTMIRLGLPLFMVVFGLSGCMTGGVKPDSAGLNRATTVPASAIETPSPPAVQSPAMPAESASEPAPAADIWRRLADGFQLTGIDNPRIEHEIARLRRSPLAFHALMARSEPFLFHILGRVEAEGLPTELALLPAVESGFRAHVYSPDGAAGLWQFMPATGSMLGLDQDWWHDRRRAILPATDAAITYLLKLNRRFDGDWLHTLAAYNAGAGTVGRAIRRAAKRDEPTEFWALDLPGETDRYVPRLLAMAAVVRDPAAYGLELPEIPNHRYFVGVDTGGQIDLNVAAGLAGMPVEELLRINAGHKRWASRPSGPHQLLLPVDKAAAFTQALSTLPEDQRLRWRRHRIARGDSLSRIARQYGVTVTAIRESNKLKDSRIRAGKDLLIPLSESVTSASAGSNQQARQRLRYRVRKGDSLYKIARRFQVSIADLKKWNQVGRYIRPGENLTVFIDPDA
jgi:membrane-bound lytic murein transglycosylase D